jgi:hypothetical protein
MTLLVPNVGENITLSYLVGKTTTVRNLIYGLFATNVTPAETDTAGSYTEAAGGGYAAKTLTGASWVITNGAPTSADFAQQTWTFTGALTTNPTVFGYFVIRATDVDLVLAETFTSFTPANNGDQILLTPKITCD